MRYIYMTDVHWCGQEEIDDVMIFPYGDEFTKLTPEIVSELFKLRGWDFNECYWVKADEAQYYIYSACWLHKGDEDNWVKALNDLKAKAA